jgi:EAL and modified HD-GYP domain-containing signal transduction protein
VSRPGRNSTQRARSRAPIYAYVGRQALFTPGLKVEAYELLYRDSEENRARFSDGNQATAATMLNAFVELGIEKLVGDRPVWINLPLDFLIGRYPVPFDPGRVVLEVLEDVPVTAELMEALRGWKARGYRIALDDFILDERTRPLLPLADYIKLDVLHLDQAKVTAEVEALRPCGAKLVAEKICTQDDFDFLKTLEFELYQGHFLELPIIGRGRRLPHNRAAIIQLLTKLYAPDSDLRDVERILAQDVGLTYRLLRLANSAALSRGAQIGSVGQAMARLGTQQLAALVLLIGVAGFDDKPSELLTQAMIRARLSEQLARQAGVTPADHMFTAGLLSLIDALLDQPLAELLAQLPLSPLIVEALGGGATKPAQIIAAVRQHERGEVAALGGLGISAEGLATTWRDALVWSRELMGVLG